MVSLLPTGGPLIIAIENLGLTKPCISLGVDSNAGQSVCVVDVNGLYQRSGRRRTTKTSRKTAAQPATYGQAWLVPLQEFRWTLGMSGYVAVLPSHWANFGGQWSEMSVSGATTSSLRHFSLVAKTFSPDSSFGVTAAWVHCSGSARHSVNKVG